MTIKESLETIRGNLVRQQASAEDVLEDVSAALKASQDSLDALKPLALILEQANADRVALAQSLADAISPVPADPEPEPEPTGFRIVEPIDVIDITDTTATVTIMASEKCYAEMTYGPVDGRPEQTVYETSSPPRWGDAPLGHQMRISGLTSGIEYGATLQLWNDESRVPVQSIKWTMAGEVTPKKPDPAPTGAGEWAKPVLSRSGAGYGFFVGDPIDLSAGIGNRHTAPHHALFFVCPTDTALIDSVWFHARMMRDSDLAK
ncbi:MAG: hypothetical protein HKN43_00825, partial [Rhodothermales bacterium]|nr:hypothetical protein [Rhodothermales bacterium]